MTLTMKDLQIINSALGFFQAEMSHTGKGDPLFDLHKEHFGNPLKTIETTRNKVYTEMAKKEGCA